MEPSDKNCSKSCGLQYGISDVFNQIVLQEQKVKLSKSHVQPKTFDDPNEQNYYCHMLDDVMIKTFDSQDEQKIFRKSLEGMNLNYPEILKGQEKNMFYCPTAFNFSSRIGIDESSVPDTLDEMKISLESKQHLSKEDSENLKKIRKYLEKLRPELAEQEFVDALACFFYKNRGIFIHSMKLDDHLKVLTNKARDYRRQNKGMGFELTDFEKKLLKQLNISNQTLIDIADIVVTHLSKKPKANNMARINGKLIRESIDDKLKGNDQMYVMKQFKPAKDYTIDEIRNGIMLGKFESECRVAGENDLCIMIPDSKLILSVEIKRHMKYEHVHTQSASTPQLDKNMISASQQLRKNARFIAVKHGTILSPDWRFAKVCAISPSVYHPERICSYCKKFVLTSDIVRTTGRLEKWWKESGLSNRDTLFDQKVKDEAYREFQLFFNRVVCMSSVRVVSDPFHTWVQVQGNTQHHMGAGHTQASRAVGTNAASGGLDFEYVLKASHHAYKTLFFSKDQMAILTTNNFPSVIFLCDFGAGKSLICKEKCIQRAEEEHVAEISGLKSKADPVFFISLVGVCDKYDKTGMLKKEGIVDEDEHIFDLYTKRYEFLGSNVQVISAQDLWAFYESKNNGADRKQVDIFILVEYFVQSHPNGHYALDECPFLMIGEELDDRRDARSVKRLSKFLKRCRQQLSSDTNMFWVSLQSNLLADLSKVENDFEKAVQEMKEEMNRDGWLFPTLSANMRNQINIANVKIEKGEYTGNMQSSIIKLKSGSSLVGEIPLLFKVRDKDWKRKKKEVLKHTFELMCQKNDNNIVVLWDHDTLFKDVADDIKKVIKDKEVVAYPSKQSKNDGIINVQNFIEKRDHILVTKKSYFNGCECTNVIFLTSSIDGDIRNTILRGVQNIIAIQFTDGKGMEAKINGMKEDNRFLPMKK